MKENWLRPAFGAGDVPLEPQLGLQRYRRLSRIVAGTFFLLIFLLAAVVNLHGAVVAFGELDVDSKVKKISHPTGGVVAAIAVRDGDHVKQGQVLLRFDTTVSGVTAQVSDKSLDQLLATQARLTAERDGAATIYFPDSLTRAPAPSASAAMSEERRLFMLRREGREGVRRQLAERIAQAEQQISAYQVQIGASRAQSELIGPEQKGMEDLYRRQLVTLNRLNELKRTAVSLSANAASLAAQIAQSRAQISEYRQQMLQTDQDARSQAGAELLTVNQQVAEQQVRKASATDTFDRSAVRAPQSGIVDKLAFSTVGSTIPPNQTILEIVPDRDRLTVQAKISPADIDKVQPGQETELRFTTFNARVTPQLKGRLRTVSADRQSDERSGASFYTVLIDVAPSELAKLGKLQLVPGTPVEAYIQTARRSMLSYLLRPVADQFSRSFRQG